MIKKLIVSTILAACGTVALALATVPLSGQAAAPAAARAIPRGPDGKPNFSGVWENLSKANWNIEPHSASRISPASAGIVEGGMLPYKPEALGKRAQNFANRATADTEAKCFLPGVPRIMYQPFPFQIVQTPSLFMMLFEYVHATRNAYMNSPHMKGPLDFWMGDSRAKWEGDTMVVDTNNFNEETWFDKVGNYHSDQLHVTERFTLADADHISYAATIEDPTVYTRPWTMNLVFYRHTELNFRLLDYECYAFALDDVPIVVPK
jgi:hypothetical protein